MSVGYMGIRILTFDDDFKWEKDLTQDFCEDFKHREWNPKLYDELKKKRYDNNGEIK